MARQDFLFELGTEELPPRALARLSEDLTRGVVEGLKKQDLAHGGVKSYATPRRLAVLVENLDTVRAGQVNERRGPALSAAFGDDGIPTAAAQGFARSCGVTVDELETLKNERGAWLVYRTRQADVPTATLLPAIIAAALAALPIPKRMRWGSLTEAFVRPVHWVVMLHGDQVVEAGMFGVRAGRETRGHRFHHPGALYLPGPAAYAPLLESSGRVMADFAARREAIRGQVMAAAAEVQGEAVIDDSLLDEVTGMVEWPVAVVGSFDAAYLRVPAEALVSAMKGHQKYFHLVDEEGCLLPRFIAISNIESSAPDLVREGNERVIRPRLADAAFFWEQDRKTPLAQRLEDLKHVVFQKKLGTLWQKTQRVTALAGDIARRLDGSADWAERAAQLSRCDLLTDMVGEFPELQGIMGRYYAAHDGEPAEVAQALDELYMPRFAGDRLPVSVTGQALAIADRLDTLVGIFGIGLTPTGDKDPFALRRAALGLLRILIEQRLDLDLLSLLKEAAASYGDAPRFDQALPGNVFDFMMERLRAYYHDKGIAPDVFTAVLQRRPTVPVDFDDRIRAVETFRGLPEAESLATAHKRISNILRKAPDTVPGEIDTGLLREPEEKALASRIEALSRETAPYLARGDYTCVLTTLAGLREPVDAFFDEVMVMCEDDGLRGNRLALLASLRKMFLQVADLSCLQAVQGS